MKKFVYYPEYEDPSFQTKILKKREIWENRYTSIDLGQDTEMMLASHQKLLGQYFNPTTPYTDLLVYHGVGVGKCHGKDTPILTFNGNTVLVQDVREGDLLLGDDGKPRKVLSLARGQDDMYGITPTNESFEPFTANKEHILCLYNTVSHKIEEIAIKNYLLFSDDKKREYLAYKVDVNFSFKEQEEAAYEYGKKIHERGFGYIPTRYKTGSRLQRKDLINGIIDSYEEEKKIRNSNTVYLMEDRPMLVSDILFVARSLGYPAYKGKNGLFIILQEYKHQFSEFTIEYLGRGDYYGFVIDQNHRYLLNDFTVTHNTLTSIQIAEQHKHIYNIIVLVKNQTIAENYKKSLRKYYSEISRESLDSLVDYEFITFGVLKDTMKFDNTLMIVDEAHNITGNNTDILLRKIKAKSSNFKLVLLTATPIFDSAIELFQITDLLNTPKKWVIQKTDIDAIKRELIDKKLIEVEGDTPVLTAKGLNTLNPLLKGKVSYLSVDENSVYYPKLIDRGELLPPFKKLLLVPCYMQGKQRQVYLEALEKESRKDAGLYDLTLKASEFVYPNGNLDDYSKFPGYKYFTSEMLKEYGCKFYEIVKNINKYPGTHFVYSELVNERGLDLLKKVLKANKITFMIISGEMTSTKERFKKLEYFNAPDNKNGSKLKVVLGSLVLSEGISFKNVRNVHILEPYWNLSRLEQIIGRASRLGSHNDLPISERYVNVFKYVSLVKDAPLEYSMDLQKYLLAENKDFAIKSGDRLLKELAFDCELHKQRNFLNKKYDGTRKCDYQKCNWPCLPSILPETDRDLDNSTFRGEETEIKKSQKLIEALFEKENVYTINYLVNHVLSKTSLGVKPMNIYLGLKRLTRTGKFYAYGDYFIRSDSKDERVVYKEIRKIQMSKPFVFKQTQQESSKRPSSAKQSIRPLERTGIYGTYKDKYGKQDDIFRIVENTESVDDTRKQRVGKRCTSYSLTELKDLYKRIFNTDPPKKSKDNYCTIIEAYMQRSSLIE